MANRDVRLALFADINYSGRRILFRRGGVAVRDARALGFNGMLSSFRLRNEANGRDVTLVMWSRTNFRGTRRVYRGNTNIADLGNYNDRMSSFVLIGRRLTDAEINAIGNNNRPPAGILIIRQ